ncbi:MAG: tetratricopeptide repeat protein, partial [Nitrospirales bacterium]|nr:tetratricopeptide repeat protein [Nitrospirales bacterium]
SNRFALLNLALLHEKAKEYDKASRSFTRLLETGDLQGYLGMARIAEKKGQRAEALRLYREILSLNDLDTKTRKMINERLQALGDGS